jgi:hypothetical protein
LAFSALDRQCVEPQPASPAARMMRSASSDPAIESARTSAE